MASGEEQNSRSGAATRQTGRNSNRSGYGDIGLEELRGNVYPYGVNGQQEKYLKTTRAIAEYVGRVYDKSMWRLVSKRTETTFEKPKLPDDEKSRAQMEEYRMLLKISTEEKKQYTTNKAKVFRLILGQCLIPMRSKVEGLPEYDE